MKKTIALSWICLALFSGLRAQKWTWDTIVSQSSGNMLVGDGFQNIYSFCKDSFVLIKRSQQGMLWQVSLPANAHIKNVACDPDSAVYIAGNFTGQLVLSSSTLQSVGGQDMFVARYSKSGMLLWAKCFGSKGTDFAEDICLSGKRPVLTGMVADTLWTSSVVYPRPSTNDLFVLRLLPDGSPDVARFASLVPHSTVSNSQHYSTGHDIAADRAGNLALFAYIHGEVLIDTMSIYSYNYNGYGKHLILFDSMLTPQWVQPGMSGYLDWTDNLKMSSQGEVIYTRHSKSNHSGPTASIYKVALAGGSPFSIYQKFGGYTLYNHINSLALDSCDNIYFTGGRERSYSQLNYKTSYFLFAGQVSSGGVLHWLREDSSAYHARGESVALLGPNHCMLSFYFYDTIQLKNNLFPAPGQQPGHGYAVLQTTVGLPSNITSLANMHFCSGATTTLHVTSTGAITWYQMPAGGNAISTGPTFVITNLATGNYTYYAQASSCTMTTGRLPVTLTVIASPTVAVNNGAICVKGSHTISPNGAQTYYYSSGSAVVSPTANATYTIYGQLSNGCSDSALCYVSVVGLPQPTVNTSINFMCPGQTAILTGSGAQSYTWHTGQISQTISVSPTVHTNYTVTATDTNGCSNTAFITQYVADCLGVSEISTQPLSFYPNPGTGQIVVNSPEICEVIFCDATGRGVYRCKLTAGANYLDLNHLKRGLYFISRSDGAGKTHTLILE